MTQPPAGGTSDILGTPSDTDRPDLVSPQLAEQITGISIRYPTYLPQGMERLDDVGLVWGEGDEPEAVDLLYLGPPVEAGEVGVSTLSITQWTDYPAPIDGELIEVAGTPVYSRRIAVTGDMDVVQFSWRDGGIVFDVRAFGHDREFLRQQALMVVESMLD